MACLLVHGVEITFPGYAREIVECYTCRGFYARVESCSVYGNAAPAANAEYSDVFGIHILPARKVVYGSAEIFRVNVHRRRVTRFAAAFACKRGIESYCQKSLLGKGLGIKSAGLFFYGSERSANGNGSQFAFRGNRFVHIGNECYAEPVFERNFLMTHLFTLGESLVPFFCYVHVCIIVLCESNQRNRDYGYRCYYSFHDSLHLGYV